MIPTVLTIAGSDSSGGAGIQADLKSIAANGGYGASVITAITAQNTIAVHAASPVAPDMIRAQLDAVFDDLDVRAVKTGMLADAATITTVAAALRKRRPAHYVCDPVMISKSGYPLLADADVATLVRELLPLATLVTPNVHEAARLAGLPVTTPEEAVQAARRIIAKGARAVLVKGGHLQGAPASDVLVTADLVRIYAGRWIGTRHTHGTGCTYSAAIATRLALGEALEDAIKEAKRFMDGAIAAGFAVGGGHGPTDPFHAMRAVLPAAASVASPPAHVPVAIHGRLMILTDESLGGSFTHAALARLAAEGGADWIQYREKRPVTTAAMVAQAKQMLEGIAATGSGARLVIDDRADVALAALVPALHLGRDDIDPSVARRMLGPRAVIGGTANSLEDAMAAATQPVDYLGVGPVFGTASKANPAPALGLDGLAAICRAVTLPVFAIGGITAERVPDVLAQGAFGVAVLSAVTQSRDPAAATRAFREIIPS